MFSYLASGTHLESPGCLESKGWNPLATSVPNIDSKHVLSAFIEYFDDRNSMLLQSRIGHLVHSIVRLVSGVIDRLRNVLDVLVDLLLIGGRRLGVRADQVDQWLDALNEEGCLIFEVVLPSSMCCCVLVLFRNVP